MRMSSVAEEGGEEVEEVSKVVKIVFVTVATGLDILLVSALKLTLENMEMVEVPFVTALASGRREGRGIQDVTE